jgi:3',5'-cyclic-AMP phosphodiesterase
MSDFIETNTNDDGVDRRGFLKCMAWAGTGVIWSINGGLLTSTVLGQEASNQNAIATAEMNFVQISDSHIGFNKPANTDVVGTFRETITRINALPKSPEFLLHTGDLTHLSDPAQFDTLGELLPTPGSAPKALPVVVEATQLKKMLGLTSVTYTETDHTLAVVDSTLG